MYNVKITGNVFYYVLLNLDVSIEFFVMIIIVLCLCP